MTSENRVILRNGVPVSWKQHDTLKKIHVTCLDPPPAIPPGLSAEGVIQAFDPTIRPGT